MKAPDQKEAWDELYRSQSRPWKGTISNRTPFPFKKGDKVLDIGCGNGKTSSALIEEGYDVTGIDISDTAVEACKGSYGDKMKVICAPCDSIPLNDGSMDGTVMIHVLEHLDEDELKSTVKELIRVLRTDPKIFVRVFHTDDMRSERGERIDDRTIIRGNGIRYRYFTETELKDIFSEFHCISMERIDERTKFKTTRVRIEAVFEK